MRWELLLINIIMDPKLKRYIEIFIVLWLLYYFIYMFAYMFFLDNYCDKYSQEVKDTKKMNLFILWDCRSNYFCEVWNQKYVLWKLSSYDCKKKKLDRYEYDFYLNKYKEFTK